MAAEAPDTGWSWVIAFSCSYLHFALFGLFRSSGVMYVALLATYGATREEAAWPFSLCSAVFQLTAPLASVAVNYVSVRKASLLGCVIATIGITCCFFADNIQWINIFYGIVHGVGFGFAVTLVPVIVNQYFIRHRATAIGIAFSGGTVSSFIFPVAMEYLLDTYGLRGSFLILGGMVMNTMVAASMLRTPPWLEKQKKKVIHPSQQQEELLKSDDGSSKNFVLEMKPESNVLRKRLLDSEGGTLNSKTSFHVPIDSSVSKQPYPNIPINAVQDQGYCEDIHSNNLKNSNDFNRSLDKNVPNCGVNKNILVYTQTPPSDISDIQVFNIQEYKQFEKTGLSNGNNNSLDTHNEVGINKDWSANEDESQQSDSNLNQVCYRPNHQTENDTEILPPGKHNCDSPEFTPLLTDGTQPPKCDQQSWVGAEPSASLVLNKKVTMISKSEANVLLRSSSTSTKGFTRCGEFEICKGIVEIIQNPMFHVLTFSMCIFFLLLHTFFMVIVDFAKDKGIPESDAIYVLSMFSLTDLVGRAGLGWVTDRNYIRRKNMVMMNLAIIGILNHFYPLTNTLTGILVIAAFHGLAVGSSITLFFVLQAEYMGMKRLPLAIGMTSFFNGILTFLRPGMTGLFRDEIGSYNWMFHFLGILTLAIAAVWLAEPWLSKRSKRVDESVFSSRLTDGRKNSC